MGNNSTKHAGWQDKPAWPAGGERQPRQNLPEFGSLDTERKHGYGAEAAGLSKCRWIIPTRDGSKNEKSRMRPLGRVARQGQAWEVP